MTTDTDLAVARSVRVPLDAERAFTLFTARMGAFWPREHTIGSAPIDDVVVEPGVGGRWFERGVDGSECPWGQVAAWEPPGRVVLLWQIGPDFAYDPDLRTEVEVTFTEDGPGSTLVALTHHMAGFGDHATAMAAVFGSPQGWTTTLERLLVASTSGGDGQNVDTE